MQIIPKLQEMSLHKMRLVEIRVRGMRVWRMMVVEEEDEGD